MTNTTMPPSETTIMSAATPKYVLLHDRQPIGPRVVGLQGNACLQLYGFSDKPFYDAFCVNSAKAVTPYPLLASYLRRQAETPGNVLSLVAIDATGPNDTLLTATTIEAVIEAHEQCSPRVNVVYRLALAKAANVYDIVPDLPNIQVSSQQE